MREIQLRDAKARLSAVVDDVVRGEPAVITRHGKREAVILSFQEWERLSQVPSFGRLLMATRGINASLILCGHTDIPRVVRLRDGRMIVNPGSVGLPGYDGQTPVPCKIEVGTPDACYAIVQRTSGGWSATIRYVPYDNAAAAEMARANGMTVWASALATGWVV
jgi:prevent-host-death family protein